MRGRAKFFGAFVTFQKAPHGNSTALESPPLRIRESRKPAFGLVLRGNTCYNESNASRMTAFPLREKPVRDGAQSRPNRQIQEGYVLTGGKPMRPQSFDSFVKKLSRKQDVTSAKETTKTFPETDALLIGGASVGAATGGTASAPLATFTRPSGKPLFRKRSAFCVTKRACA